jgi:hypothetical protein
MTDNTMAKRYHMSNQKLSITEEQTTQWSKDTKWVFRNCQSQKNRQHNGKRHQMGNQKLAITEGQTT